MVVTYKTFKISIEQDHIPGNDPRDWDNIGVMAVWDDYVNNECDLKPSDEDIFPEDGPYGNSDQDFWDARKVWYVTNVKIVAILPLHEGYNNTFNTTGQGNQIGFIYILREKFNKEFNDEWMKQYHPNKTQGEVARYILNNEVQTFSYWKSGDVYGYTIDKLDDSCWGFYGDDHEASDLLSNARHSINYAVKLQTKYHLQRLKHMIRNKVSMSKRIPYKYS